MRRSTVARLGYHPPMRQVYISKAGPPEVLEVRQSPDPDAAAGQVRLRVHAAGINFADLAARTGLYPDAPPLPCVVGYEAAGVIDQVGPNVTGFAVGDRVLAMPRFGGYTDTLVVPALQVYRLPEKMSFEEGAALPVVYLTAHHAMLYTGNLPRGAKVLIHSVAGGVGLAALELARARDCVVIGTCSPGKFEFVKARGCQHPIDSGADFVPQVEQIVGAAGLDLILDPVGGVTTKRGYRLLAPCGRLVCFGFSAAQGGKRANWIGAGWQVTRMPWWNPLKLMNDNKTITGVNMGHLFDQLQILRPQIEALLAMYERGEIKPYVDRTFKLDEAPAAHHYIHERKAKGKVLLVP
jgi:NADPH:quinone reductase-like Zn-dependent oxidoreductase